VDKPITIYGVPATGSVPIEAALTLLDLPYALVEGESDRRYDVTGPLNPLRQIPTLVLPGGEVMTESAAILIHLGLEFPASDLLAGNRAQILRGLVYIAANCYSAIGIIDYPQRWLGRVSVTTTDGRTLHGAIDEPKGDPGNTLSRPELEDKFQRLLAFSGARTAEQGRVLIERVWNLRSAQSLADLI